MPILVLLLTPAPFRGLIFGLVLPALGISVHQPNGPPDTLLTKAEEGKRLAGPDRKLTHLPPAISLDRKELLGAMGWG